MLRHSEQVRALSSSDLPVITHLLGTSEYIYQRFTLQELKHILRHYPAVGLFHGKALYSFLLSQTVNPPSAWVGGFGVNWSESRSYTRFLDVQLEKLGEMLAQRGVDSLYYSGNDQQNDWLRGCMLERGFAPFRQLYAYDKFDYTIPTQGNQEVSLRRATLGDIPALLALEELCFEQIWRYDPASLADILLTHPYFVVAEFHGQIVGYQFNAVDGDYGYLVRIGVHPAYNSRGIGARLMAAAIQFFKEAHSTRIMLNTQAENTHAHRLYEWFGFVRIQQIGFVLRLEL
ncbi:MAG TPA: GNAT family N-acetyltransferase [Ktedonobacteraceae bacterium]|jgi:ribosomal-protein-alanine N-acetyltransferase|nr:GNAT family N-acetyltransferase [Ktedonobacteraceae bacterium]